MLLGGDHPDLALAELVAVLTVSGLRPRPTVEGRIVTVEVDTLPGTMTLARLGLSRRVCQALGSLELADEGTKTQTVERIPKKIPERISEKIPERIPKKIPERISEDIREGVPENIPVSATIIDEVARTTSLPGGSFRVRTTRTGEAPVHLALTDLEKDIGARLISPTNPVDLEHPGQTLRILAGNRLHWGLELEPTAYHKVERHHVRHRPHFAPVSLHPRLARAMVNLARLPVESTVIDPFCGTGGILLEAGLMDYNCFGFDLLEPMVKGTAANLAHFLVPEQRLELAQAEVGELPGLMTEVRPPPGHLAIVTDPPYGRSATTDREPLSKLMERAFEAFAALLVADERVVLAMPSDRFWESPTTNGAFKLVEHFEQRVHRSLTRHFGVLERQE